MSYDAELVRSILHTGNSMIPVLRPLDTYHITPYGDSKIQCGDVIVFQHPSSNRKVTHRIISLEGRKIITRGDNNWFVDNWVLSPEDIKGKVMYAQRRNRQLRIYGGLTGRVLTALLRRKSRITRQIRSGIYDLLRPAYQRLERSGLLKRLVPLRMKTRILTFEGSTGVERQLLMGSHVIGRCLPGHDIWQIKLPFRLFIDQESLADSNTTASRLG